MDGWLNFPREVDAFMQDHFGLRMALLGLHSRIKFSMGDSTNPDVTIGKSGWIFLGGINGSGWEDPIGDSPIATATGPTT